LASVALKHVNKVYPGGSHAVRDLDVTIADGEFVVLVGPSGCGKSTTLRMVAGLEEVTSGDIWIGDRRVNQVPPGDRDIAMVFQSYALYSHMTVRQNMAFGLKMRRTARAEIERRVTESARLLSIEPLLDRRPRELSGGQRQRVAVGRAIVRDPAVFLFDEPLSNLDAKLRGQMRGEIASLHDRLAATMIYVTHDQVEAMTLGDRLVLMNDGAVQQVGAPLEIYKHPANRFVATFIGSPSMNLFEGTANAGVFRAAGGVTWRIGDAAQGPVVLGVRPEDLTPTMDGAPVFTAARPRLIENLGHESLVHFEVASATHVARLSAEAARDMRDPFPLSIRDGAYHLFATDEEGLAIGAARA
jgi:ABC-type sugar transport system ATPase subunit